MTYDFNVTDDTPEDEEPFEYVSSFDGPCTCEHDADEHGWGSCDKIDIIDEVEVTCPCEAGWTE